MSAGVGPNLAIGKTRQFTVLGDPVFQDSDQDLVELPLVSVAKGSDAVGSCTEAGR